jgi:ribose-phosphate pyrophosphokinase
LNRPFDSKVDSSSTLTGNTPTHHLAHYNSFLKSRQQQKYTIIASPECVSLAESLSTLHPDRFTYHATTWSKFADNTDNIVIEGFTPHNMIAGSDVLFLANFHNNDVTLSQIQVMIVLLQSFITSLTVVLPYYPTGTMERVTHEGTVPTAHTYAHLFSHLPSCGKPTRLMVYDLHTLQNRFYIHNNAIASLHTAIPLLKRRIKDSNINCIAFPDDGAAKRFSSMFANTSLETVICGKTRGPNNERNIRIQEGDVEGKHVLIIDDLVQTGGTLYETGKVLKSLGAKSVNAFVTHAVFPKESYKRFDAGGDRNVFDKFFITNSVPTTTSKIEKCGSEVFEVLDLTDSIVNDLDSYSSL